MGLSIHQPYPGVALAVTTDGTILIGAPADAFKATKAYCQEHQLPFPRVLVAPRRFIARATPQFVPEFFLYDFLFVYGAAFKPGLANERLVLVLDADRQSSEKDALRLTLIGPTRAEMNEYRDRDGQPLMSEVTAGTLGGISESMALRRGGGALAIEDMVTTLPFDETGRASLFDGRVSLERRGDNDIAVIADGDEKVVHLHVPSGVVPFNTLPTPKDPMLPLGFGVQSLGVRSGFDLSGPTTGFLLWVNGRGVLFDGPARARYLLDSQGIAFSDIDALILSHCHEDHMNSFVELILTGHRPRVYTAEPIYRSALIKLANYFGTSADDVAKFIDYQRIVPGEPLFAYGARFDFNYTVHPIPTLGVAVSLRDEEGVTHRIVITGDTLSHDGVEKLRAAGVVPQAMRDELLSAVPTEKVENSVYFADVGESLIHGDPKDWKGNPNHVVYYHCPDNEHTRSFEHEIAQPGRLYTFVEGPGLAGVLPSRILAALGYLSLADTGWLTQAIHRGRTRRIEAGEPLCRQGVRDGVGDTLRVVVAGTAQLEGKPDRHDFAPRTLRPGDFLGGYELVDAQGRAAHTVIARTPMIVFDVPIDLMTSYVRENALESMLEQIRAVRPVIDASPIFAELMVAERNMIARNAVDERYPSGELIVEQGQMADDFFVLAQGDVEITRGKELVETIAADARDNWFGEGSAIYPTRPRDFSAHAVTPVRVLRLLGKDLRKLYFERNMALRYTLSRAMRSRGGSSSA